MIRILKSIDHGILGFARILLIGFLWLVESVFESCRLVLSISGGSKDLVGDCGGFYGGASVVDAEDVGSGEDCGYVSCSGCVDTIAAGG